MTEGLVLAAVLAYLTVELTGRCTYSFCACTVHYCAREKHHPLDHVVLLEIWLSHVVVVVEHVTSHMKGRYFATEPSPKLHNND